MKEFLQKQRLHLHFEITSRRLQLMMNLGNIRALEDMGGVEGIAALLLVECDVGLSKEERLDAYIDRIEECVVCCFVYARACVCLCLYVCVCFCVLSVCLAIACRRLVPTHSYSSSLSILPSLHQFRRQQLSQPRVGQHYHGFSLVLERYVLSACSRARPCLFRTFCAALAPQVQRTFHILNAEEGLVVILRAK